jgi:hypothetical protein
MGNEFSVAFFIHPSLSKTNPERFIPAIQVFAKLFGRVMPFWMAGTLLLHLALAWAIWTSHHSAGIFNLYAGLTWALIVVFSVVLPVPINNRVGLWNPSNLPPNWKTERKLWDTYNSIRVMMIGLAFVFLLVAYRKAGPC